MLEEFEEQLLSTPATETVERLRLSGMIALGEMFMEMLDQNPGAGICFGYDPTFQTCANGKDCSLCGGSGIVPKDTMDHMAENENNEKKEDPNVGITRKTADSNN